MSDIGFIDIKRSSRSPQAHEISRELGHWRAKVASLTRSRTFDDPELVSARHNMEIASARDQIHRAISGVQEMTETEREYLRSVI